MGVAGVGVPERVTGQVVIVIVGFQVETVAAVAVVAVQAELV